MSSGVETPSEGNRFRKDSFVRASELHEKQRWCPRCGDLEAIFQFKMFVQSGSNSHPRARYACTACGCRRCFDVVVNSGGDSV